MPLKIRAPLRATLTANQDMALEWPPDTVFSVRTLEDMFIFPVPYKDLRERLGRGAPVPQVMFGEECLTAYEVYWVVNHLPKIQGFLSAEHCDEALE